MSEKNENLEAIEPAEALPKESEEIQASPEPEEVNPLSQELAETKDRLLRLAADFDNFKKTSQREQLNTIKFANEAFITNLLPIIDNLEQAVALKTAENDVVSGVEMVLKQFKDLLEKAGVEVFSAMGQMFDPARHEALGQKEDDAVAEGTVVMEYQKGYLLHQRLIRPARVMVAKPSGN